MQAWLGNNYVGDVKASVRPELQSYSIPMMSDVSAPLGPDEDVSVPMNIEYLQLKITRRQFVVDHRDIEMNGEEFLAHMLRERHADMEWLEKTSDFHRDSIRYSWKVFGLDLKAYEMLFDLDLFEPREYGPPDYERRMNRNAWSFDTPPLVRRDNFSVGGLTV